MSTISNLGDQDRIFLSRDQNVSVETTVENSGFHRFRLTLMFAITMLVAMVVAALVVNLMVGRMAKTHLVRIAQETTAQDMAHVQSMMRDPELMPAWRMAPGNDPAASPEKRHQVAVPGASAAMTMSLNRLVAGDSLSTMYPTMVAGMNIVDFKILNLAGEVVWSPDPDSVDVTKRPNPMFIAAATGGMQSVLVADGNSPGTNQAQHPAILKTFLPLRENPGGPVIGVIEVDRNVAANVARQVNNATSAVRMVTMGTLGVLFVVLLGFIAVADGATYRANQRRNLEIEEANRDLETIVQQRTQALESANERLLETKDQLMRTEKLAVIGKLAGGVAHDLRNPLGAINNAIYYLNRKLATADESKANPRVIQFLKIIEDEVYHSNQIITDLVTYTRISTPTLSPTNLINVVNGALDGIETHNLVHMVKEFDPDLAEVSVDTEQIQRVFSNLALNAFEAMPEGGELTVTTRRNDGFAEVIFHDTGEGISDEVMPKIFEPLYTTKIKGTGMGLAICQEVITNHGGSIEVSSQMGEGSTFVVRLPLQGTPVSNTKEQA